MTIPFIDLKTQYQALKPQIQERINRVLDHGQYIMGPEVQELEERLAAHTGTRHCVTVASGTEALLISLMALGIKPGDEVITSPFTFIATAEAIRYVGATPVFVDIDPKTYNLDPQAVERAVTEKTRLIMPVHLFGQPADMITIQTIADQKGLMVIEDCAQSFGASIDGRQTGQFGIAAGYSFFPSKNLGCYGDGGLVVTRSDAMAETLLMLRNHGSKIRYYHDVIGFNSRLDEMQAAILRVKLKQIDAFNRERRRVAHRYSSQLVDLPVTTPHEDGIGVHVYHQYTVLSDQRERIMRHLTEAGIASAIYYPVPLHQQNVFKDACAGLSLPITESVASQCFSLPIYPELEDEKIDHIVEVIRAALSA